MSSKESIDPIVIANALLESQSVYSFQKGHEFNRITGADREAGVNADGSVDFRLYEDLAADFATPGIVYRRVYKVKLTVEVEENTTE